MEDNARGTPASPVSRRSGRRLWQSLTIWLSVWFAVLLPSSVFAATGGGIPAVNYGSGNSSLSQPVTTAMENIAATIRLVLGGTALVVILAAAIMNHFVHDPRAKERAKELIGAAVVGLLLAAFAPAIVNFIAGL